MDKHPLEVIREKDPELFASVESAKKTALTGGVMPVKYKLLIALALDASLGAADGVRSLAKQAMDAGASKEEVMEAVRVAGYICGVGSVYTAARGLAEVI